MPTPGPPQSSQFTRSKRRPIRIAAAADGWEGLYEKDFHRSGFGPLLHHRHDGSDGRRTHRSGDGGPELQQLLMGGRYEKDFPDSGAGLRLHRWVTGVTVVAHTDQAMADPNCSGC